jgi:hypothetical protein
VPETLWEAARELDPHYIPARYPDAFPSGSFAVVLETALARRAAEREALLEQARRWARRGGISTWKVMWICCWFRLACLPTPSSASDS